MKRMSPPTGVQARPVATPGTLVRSATSLKNLRLAQVLRADRLSVTCSSCDLASLARATSSASARHSLVISRSELPHAGLAGVVPHDRRDARRR